MSFTTKGMIVEPGRAARLKHRDPAFDAGYKDRAEVEDLIEANRARMDELQYRLYAENERALLIVLQGMDTSGKDGLVRHVMTGLDPTGCRVTSFKAPSMEEADHDFLWRVHKAVPPMGEIGVFNRSHYEEVLIVRVHGLVPEKRWRARYGQINAFEKLLADNRVVIVKLFLHISKDEQKKRLEKRLKDPAKNWKFSEQDVRERESWDQYMEAYEDALTECSTGHAPWYVVPADHKWMRDLAVSKIIVETMEGMKMRMPRARIDPGKIVIPD